jgi:hypothetical protein
MDATTLAIAFGGTTSPSRRLYAARGRVVPYILGRDTFDKLSAGSARPSSQIRRNALGALTLKTGLLF